MVTYVDNCTDYRIGLQLNVFKVQIIAIQFARIRSVLDVKFMAVATLVLTTATTAVYRRVQFAYSAITDPLCRLYRVELQVRQPSLVHRIGPLNYATPWPDAETPSRLS